MKGISSGHTPITMSELLKWQEMSAVMVEMIACCGSEENMKKVFDYATTLPCSNFLTMKSELDYIKRYGFKEQRYLKTVSAGKLRESCVILPDNIPDCAWVPRASIHTEIDDRIDMSNDSIGFSIYYTFSEPFKWVTADVEFKFPDFPPCPRCGDSDTNLCVSGEYYICSDCEHEWKVKQ